MGERGRFPVCPGLYEHNGAQALGYGGAVSFTIHSNGATAVELLLFHRMEKEPYAVIPFPENYRIGDVWSMVVFGLDITQFEYAYRVDGPWDPKKGLLFDKKTCAAGYLCEGSHRTEDMGRAAVGRGRVPCEGRAPCV